MKTIFTILFVIATTAIFAQDLQFQWVKEIPVINCMTTDSKGNAIIAGTFSDSLQYGGQTLYSDSTSGYFDVFVAKIDSSSNLLWLKKIGGSTDEYVSDIDVDMNDNIIVSIIFKYKAFIETDTIVSTSSSHSALLVKYNEAGLLLWDMIPVKNDYDCVHLFLSTIDADNNILISGNIQDLFLNSSGVFPDSTILDPDSTSYFIAKYDESGQFLWVVGSKKEINQMATDPTGNLVFSTDSMLKKYTYYGGFLWEQPLDFNTGNSNYYYSQLAIDSLSNIYMIGKFDSTLQLGADIFVSNGYSDIILQKLSPDGNHIWGVQFGGPHYDSPSMLAINHNRLIIAGNFIKKIYIDTDSLFTARPNNLITNTFIAGYDLYGNFLFDNLISSNRSFTNARVVASDKIYISVGATDSTWFDGEVFIPEDFYGTTYLAKLDGLGTGIEELSTNLLVFPNPTSDYISINKAGLIEIYNVQGKLIRTENVEANERIYIGDLSNGIYLCRFTGNSKANAFKIQKL